VVGEHAETGGVGVVVHHEDAVRGPVDVELDPVRPEGPGGREGLDGVLAGYPARTPVG
jgi:hypothetical protein